VGDWVFLDYVFAIIIAASTILALTKGLMRELVSLAALLAGFVLAAFYYPVVGSVFKGLTRTDAIANLIGFLIIFLGTLILGAIVTFIVNKLVKATSLEWVDRLLGALYGFVRGWAVASIIVLALVAFPIREGMLARSVLAPYLLAGARAAVYAVPRELRDSFNVEYKKVIEAWNNSRKSSS
jgi:membrane protein required for colicin V production